MGWKLNGASVISYLMNKGEEQGETNLNNGLFSEASLTCLSANIKSVQNREEKHKPASF